jgi:O-antigen ligase
MNFIADSSISRKATLLFLGICLAFAMGFLIAHQPLIFIIFSLLIFLAVLLPFHWITWIVIAIAPLQFTVIRLHEIPYLEDIPYKISYLDVLSLLLIFNLLWTGAFKKVVIAERHFSYILSLFCLVGLVSLLKAPNPLLGFYYLLRLGMIFIIFFSVIHYFREYSFEQSLSSLYICFWLIISMAIINEFFGFEKGTVKVLLEDPGSVDRLRSIYDQPNVAGHTIGIFLPIFLGFSLLPEGTWKTRFLLMATAFFLGFILLLTESRGGMIVGTVGLVMLLFYVRRFSLLPIALFLCGFFIFNVDFIRELFFDVRFSSIDDRVDLLYYGMNTFVEHPILGIGLRQFEAHFHDLPFHLMGSSSHNAYLEVLVEMGILGFGTFVIFLISVYKKLIDATDGKKKYARLIRGVVLSSFFAILCSKLFMGGLLLVTWWIALAVILGFTQRFSFSQQAEFFQINKTNKIRELPQ